jgi:hypothetical protein
VAVPKWEEVAMRRNQRPRILPSFAEVCPGDDLLSSSGTTRIDARTIAGLGSSERIEHPHVSEAINYRLLDRNLWT